MGCYKPIPARRSETGGRWRLHPELGTADAQLPCGKCLGCRTDRQSDWVARCLHEAAQFEQNRFITLTYDDEHLPAELRPDDLQRFVKRLRKAIGCEGRNERFIYSDRSSSIRYVACGEYGERTCRPHYHLIVFNCSFADETKYDEKLSTSRTLEQLWRNGAAKLAPFSSATAAYVAGYLTKTGKVNYRNALGQTLAAPFFRASLRPAIGRNWIEKHQQDLQHGYLIREGIKARIPRYYVKKLLAEKTSAARHYNELKTGGIRQTTDKYSAPRVADAEKIHQQAANNKQRNTTL